MIGEKLYDKWLQHQIKQKLKVWYAAQGIDMKQLERTTNQELLELLNRLVVGLQTENKTYKQRIDEQDKTIEGLAREVNKAHKAILKENGVETKKSNVISITKSVKER